MAIPLLSCKIRLRLAPPRPSLLRGAVLAALGASTGAQAPAADETTTSATQQVRVTGHSSAAGDLTGFDAPLARTPIDATVVDAQTLADIDARSLSDLARVDAALTDAYDAVGYWTTFSIRGFAMDNRYNFRRDGLPINGETMLPLENKSAVEILKGLSGLQAGTSAPGGLVNLVVKRPDIDLRSASLAWTQPGTLGTQIDLSQRFGDARQFGARLNVSASELDTYVRDTAGHRQTASLATDWRPDAGHHLEFEFEHSLQSEPSQPGFSMLGPVVPDARAIDPRINLNDQPWSLPVVMQGNTLSVRYTQALGETWQLRLQAMQQSLVSNDHLAFPFGYPGCDICDRYSSTGQFSLYDFRSDDERRQTRVADATLSGEADTGPAHHTLAFEVQVSRFDGRFQDEAYNLVGTGTIDGRTVLPSDPTLAYPNDDRTERSTELALRDTLRLGDAWAAWAGVRHTALHRSSWPTALGDPAEATDYRQSFTTPWLAISRAFGPADMAYLSWGQGVESSVTPNLAGVYFQPGAPQPATKSRQWEGGWKHAADGHSWSLVAYDVQQPQWSDVLEDDNLLHHLRDGIVHARGVEAEALWRGGPWTLRASAMVQRVHSEETSDSVDGTTPPNIPTHALKLLAAYAVSALPGLSLQANLAHEGPRAVLPDDSASIPAWTSVDLGARFVQPVQGATLVWRAGVANAFDRRAWREAPYQYGHAYLYPLAPRTWHASLEADF